jgi:hypothetical protein
MAEVRNTYKYLIRNSRGKTPVGRQFVDGRIILKFKVGK